MVIRVIYVIGTLVLNGLGIVRIRGKTENRVQRIWRNPSAQLPRPVSEKSQTGFRVSTP